jgi:hypothetical protein
MGLDPIDLPYLLVTDNEPDQGHLGKQGPLNFSPFVGA